MKKILQVACVAITLCLSIFFAHGCSQNGNLSAKKASSKNKYDLYIFSSKGEISQPFKELCDIYEKEKGIKIRLQQIGSGTNHLEPLRIQMSSSEKPSIFSIQGLRELIEWQYSKTALDFNDSTLESFKNLANEIPSNFRLTSDGKNNYGIPYSIEGYGYIADKQMLCDIFGESNLKDIMKDLKLSSYGEFENFVESLDFYIKTGNIRSFELNGRTYIPQKDKVGLAKNLEAVFSVAGAERWTYCDHMVNIALGAVFKSPFELLNADNTKADSMRGALKKYAKSLDLKTSHAMVKRGPEFINVTSGDYNRAIKDFSDGKTIFIKQGNWIGPNISKLNPDMLKRLVVFPVKMDMSNEDIKRDDMTVDKFNRSIPVYVPNFFAINAKVDIKEQELAEEFLVWLNTSEIAKEYIINKFGFIPYNAPDDLVLDSSLNNSILEYKRSSDTLGAVYHGVGENWSKETLGLKIMEDYLTKTDWEENDYNDIACFAIEKFKELKVW